MLIEREVVKRNHLEDIVLETLMKSNLYKVLDYSKKPGSEMPGRNFENQQNTMPAAGRLSGVLSQSRNVMYYETLNGSEPISINRLSRQASPVASPIKIQEGKLSSRGNLRRRTSVP